MSIIRVSFNFHFSGLNSMFYVKMCRFQSSFGKLLCKYDLIYLQQNIII